MVWVKHTEQGLRYKGQQVASLTSRAARMLFTPHLIAPVSCIEHVSNCDMQQTGSHKHRVMTPASLVSLLQGGKVQ